MPTSNFNPSESIYVQSYTSWMADKPKFYKSKRNQKIYKNKKFYKSIRFETVSPHAHLKKTIASNLKDPKIFSKENKNYLF